MCDLKSGQLYARELSLSGLAGRHKSAVERLVRLRSLVESPSIKLSGKQVVGGRDGVDVSSQVKVELVHWNYL